MEYDYNEVFGLPEAETGAEEQEVAEPAPEGAEEQEVAEPAVEQDKPELEHVKTEEDARYAAARRQAERERDEAIAKARQEAQAEAQRTVDEAFRSAGLTNPYTGSPITTKAEYDAYLTQYQQEQKETIQKKAGITPAQFQQFVNSLPEIRQAREAQAQAERAATQAREAQAKAALEEQMKEISALDPTVKELKDLTKMPNYQQFYDLVKRGNTFVDAYKLANYDTLTQRAADASRKAAVKAAASKEHLSHTAQRGQGAVTVPVDIMQAYKDLNPDATPDQIQKHYQKYLNH